MKAVNQKVLVRVNMKQKDTLKIAGVTVSTALLFETNYREKSPTVAEVIEGNGYLNPGEIILCHHNTFYTPSPYHLQDDLFAIPATSKIVFAVVNKDGSLFPSTGNIICSRVEIPSPIPLPPEKIKTYIDRAIVTKGAGYKAGQLIFHRPHAGYDIVYNVNGVEYRVTKVPSEQVTGVVVSS